MPRLILVAPIVLALTSCGDSKVATTAPSQMAAVAFSPPTAGSPVGMKGTVADGAFRSLAGARVEVLDGPQAGMTTTTDSRGEFSVPRHIC